MLHFASESKIRFCTISATNVSNIILNIYYLTNEHIVKKQVIHCYRKEGVNHYENCRDVVKDFHEVIKKKDLGQVHPNWSKPEMYDGW